MCLRDREISAAPRRGTRGAADREFADRRWTSTGPSDRGLVAEEERIRHGARRQVAPWLETRVRPQSPRLRRVLRDPQRRRRLLHAQLNGCTRNRDTGGRGRPVGEPDPGRTRRLPHGPVVGPRRGIPRSSEDAAVLPQPALQRAARAMGRTGGRGPRSRGAWRRSHDERRHAEDLRVDDEEHGRRDRPCAEGSVEGEARSADARDLHERQRRRALLVQLAVLLSEAVSLGGRHTCAGDGPVARRHPRGPGVRAGVNHDGLDRDDPGGNRNGGRSRVPDGRRGSALGLQGRSDAGSHAVLAHAASRCGAVRFMEVFAGRRGGTPLRSVERSRREGRPEVGAS